MTIAWGQDIQEKNAVNFMIVLLRDVEDETTLLDYIFLSQFVCLSSYICSLYDSFEFDCRSLLFKDVDCRSPGIYALI